MSKKSKVRKLQIKKPGAAIHANPQIKKEEVKHEITKTFISEVLGPIAHMVGHSLSAGVAYGCFCAAEIVIAKILQWIFAFGTVHQIEMFEKGESIIFYAGFTIWCVTFLIGAIRLILVEFKLIGK